MLFFTLRRAMMKECATTSKGGDFRDHQMMPFGSGRSFAAAAADASSSVVARKKKTLKTGAVVGTTTSTSSSSSSSASNNATTNSMTRRQTKKLDLNPPTIPGCLIPSKTRRGTPPWPR